MKWKQALTAEEAALIVMGLDEYLSIDEAFEELLPLPSDMTDYKRLSSAEYAALKIAVYVASKKEGINILEELEASSYVIDTASKLAEVRKISEAIKDEIFIAYKVRYKKDLTETTTKLVIAHWCHDHPKGCRTLIERQLQNKALLNGFTMLVT